MKIQFKRNSQIGTSLPSDWNAAEPLWFKDKLYIGSIGSAAGGIRDTVGDLVPMALEDHGHDDDWWPNAVQDQDGNWYDAVIIGDQVWMASNLRTTHAVTAVNGSTDISVFYGNESTDLSTSTPAGWSYTEKYRWYWNSSSSSNPSTQNGDFYLRAHGYLYNWCAAMDGSTTEGVRGIAPEGWHIPTKDEFQELIDYTNSIDRYRKVGDKKALASQFYWTTGSSGNEVGLNTHLNNGTGFSAVPAGRKANGITNNSYLKYNAYIWTSSTDTRTESASYDRSNTAYMFLISYSTSVSVSLSADKNTLKTAYASVRCICDMKPLEFKCWYMGKYGTKQHTVDTQTDIVLVNKSSSSVKSPSLVFSRGDLNRVNGNDYMDWWMNATSDGGFVIAKGLLPNSGDPAGATSVTDVITANSSGAITTTFAETGFQVAGHTSDSIGVMRSDGIVDEFSYIHIYRNATGTPAYTSRSPYICARWDVIDDPTVTEYYDGMVVCIKVPVAGNGSYGTAFQINELGYKPVVYNVNTMIGTRYAVGSVVWAVYNETQTAKLYLGAGQQNVDIDGCWQVMDYNSDTTTITTIRRYYASQLTTTADLLDYTLTFRKNETHIVPIHSVPAGTSGDAANQGSLATNKTMTTESFDPFGDILFHRYNHKYTANTLIGIGVLFMQYGSLLDARRIFNCGQTLISKKELYLVVDLQSDGTVKLAQDPCWSQTLPTTNDGHLYIFLGVTYDSYRFELLMNHPIYYHDGTKLRHYTGIQKVSDIANDSNFISGPQTSSKENILTFDNTTGNAAADSEVSVRRLWENVDIVSDLGTTYQEYEWLFNSSGVWVHTYTAYKHCVLPAKDIRRIKVFATSSNNTYVTFFKTYTPPTGSSSGNGPVSTLSDKYSSIIRVGISAGSNATLDVPNDANYIYVALFGQDASMKPEHFYVTGIGITEHLGDGTGFIKDDGTVDNTSYALADDILQSDFNETDAESNAYIKAKPVFGAGTYVQEAVPYTSDKPLKQVEYSMPNYSGGQGPSFSARCIYQDGFEARITAQSPTTGIWRILGSADTNGNNTAIGIIGSSSGNINFKIGGTVIVTSSITRTAGHIYTVDAKLDSGTVTLYVKDETDGTEATDTSTYTSLPSGYNAIVWREGSNRASSGIKTYRIETWLNGVKQSDWIPVKNTSSGNYGFYDTISGIFEGDDITSGGAVVNKSLVVSIPNTNTDEKVTPSTLSTTGTTYYPILASYSSGTPTTNGKPNYCADVKLTGSGTLHATKFYTAKVLSSNQTKYVSAESDTGIILSTSALSGSDGQTPKLTFRRASDKCFDIWNDKGDLTFLGRTGSTENAKVIMAVDGKITLPDTQPSGGYLVVSGTTSGNGGFFKSDGSIDTNTYALASSVKDATLTVKGDGTYTSVGTSNAGDTFTANASSNKTITVNHATRTESTTTSTAAPDLTSSTTANRQITIVTPTFNSAGHETGKDTKTVTFAQITAASLGLTDIMHFKGAVSSLPTATTSDSYSNGDVIIVTSTNKEYVRSGKTSSAAGSWIELGDEGSYALKTTTVTGTGALGGGGALSSNQIITHNTSGVGAGSYGPSESLSPAAGTGFSVPYVTVDAYGHITAASTKTITLPADSDKKVTPQVLSTSGTTAYPILAANNASTPTTNGQPNYCAAVGVAGNGTLTATKLYTSGTADSATKSAEITKTGIVLATTGTATDAAGQTPKLTFKRPDSYVSYDIWNKNGILTILGRVSSTERGTVTIGSFGTITLPTSAASNGGYIKVDGTSSGAGGFFKSDGSIDTNTYALASSIPNNIVNTITTTAGTHTALTNSTGSVSFNVPTKTSHLENDSGYITDYSVKTLKSSTSAQTVPGSSGTALKGSGDVTLHKVAWTGTYSDLIGTPTITDEKVTRTVTTGTDEYPVLFGASTADSTNPTEQARYSASLKANGNGDVVFSKSSTKCKLQYNSTNFSLDFVFE
jgi:uncharacterized protein (TIGR02145 family)